ncbi:MAG: PHP-associated domain-containing protein [Patescibacteria group bacterium]
MKSVKVQFHVHTARDPVDRPSHTEKEMLDFAAKEKYDVVAITAHNSFIFDEELKSYAAKRKILLVPGIEKDIEGCHVLIINATKKAEEVNDFHELQEYKKSHPDCIIIAAHPYYFTDFCLKEKLDQHHALFDAIEYSWYHTKRINKWNKKAERTAKKYGIPMIATSDNHILKYFDQQYSLIDVEEKNWTEIRKGIKENRIVMNKNPLDFFEFLILTIRMILEFNIPCRWRRFWKK